MAKNYLHMNFIRHKRFFLIAAINLITFIALSTLLPIPANARPGGGHSYNSTKKKSSSSSSTRSSSSSSSSSDDNSSYWDKVELNDDNSSSSDEDYDIPDWVTWAILSLLVAAPAYGGIVSIKEKIGKMSLVSSASSKKEIDEKAAKRDSYINQLKENDPNFSTTLFLDFAASIFTKYHALQGSNDFKNLSPYLTAVEIAKQNKKIKKEISEIVIGSIDIKTIYPKRSLISVDISANYTVLQKGKKTRYDVLERWSFKRNPNLLSPVPEKMRELSCPKCGASVGFTDTGTCESCGTLVKNGEMQWYVSSRNKLYQQVFETSGLAHYEKEKGTRLDTIYNSNSEIRLKQFADIQNVNTDEWLSLFERKIVHEYFTIIYDAWSVNKLDEVRHLLSDRLYDSFMFWISAYKSEGLTNRLDNLKIKEVKLAKIELDKFYESVTVRIFASCKDYVTDKQGKVMGGSNRKFRKFSEYWTFIRRSGVETDSYDYRTCPNCGAPADKMGQSGTCEYCNTKISNGDFSWVLAVITQDEVYKG